MAKMDADSESDVDPMPAPLATSTPEKTREEVEVDPSVADLSVEDDCFGPSRRLTTAVLRAIYESDEELSKVEDPNWELNTRLFNTLRNNMELANSREAAFLEKSVFEEVAVRLGYMMEDGPRWESRFRVMVAVVVVCLRTWHELNEDMMCWFHSWVQRQMDSENPFIRAAAILMMGKLFRHWLAVPLFNDSRPFTMEKWRRNQLYGVMRAAMTDKAVVVRVALVNALAELQKMPIPSDFALALERSPKDMIFAAMQDKNAAVQLAAVQVIELAEASSIQVNKLAHVAGASLNKAARREGISRLGELPLGSIPHGVVQEVLLSCFNDPDPEIREFCKLHLLNTWLCSISLSCSRSNGFPNGRRGEADEEPFTCLGQGLLVLLNHLEFHIVTDEIDKIMFHAMDLIRATIHKGRMVNVAELATYLTMEGIQPPIVTRYNKDILLDDTQPNPANMAMLSYLWRCFVQYCFAKTESSRECAGKDPVALRDECLQRLCPPLIEMIDLARKMFEWKDFHKYQIKELPLDPGFKKYYSVAIAETLKIIKLLEFDHYGTQRCKELVHRLLKNTNIQASVTNVVAELIVDHLYPGTAEELIRQHLDEMNFTEAISMLELPPSREQRHPHSQPVSDDLRRTKVISHCLQVVAGVVKTGKVEVTTPYFKELITDLASETLPAMSEESSGWMIQLLTCIMMRNEDMASKYSSWLYQRAEVDTPDNKGMAHLCLYDLIHQYGRDKVERWTNRQWLGVMMNLLEDISGEPEQETYQLRCCEATCKYLLMQKDNEAARQQILSLMQALCIVYFAPKYHNFKKMREMVKQFIVIYIQQHKDSLSRWYFACMATIKRFCRNYKNHEEDMQLADIERVVQASVHWCTSDVLHQEGEKTEIADVALRFDPNFITIFYYCSMITDFASDENIVEIFTRTLDFADVTKLDRPARVRLGESIKAVYENLSDLYGVRSEVAQRTFRIFRALRQLELIDKESMQREQNDAAGTSQETAQRRRGRPRQLPVTRIKKNVTGSSQLYTAQGRNLEEDPFSDVVPQAPAEEPARPKPRASKQARRKK